MKQKTTQTQEATRVKVVPMYSTQQDSSNDNMTNSRAYENFVEIDAIDLEKIYEYRRAKLERQRRNRQRARIRRQRQRITFVMICIFSFAVVFAINAIRDINSGISEGEVTTATESYKVNDRYEANQQILESSIITNDDEVPLVEGSIDSFVSSEDSYVQSKENQTTDDAENAGRSFSILNDEEIAYRVDYLKTNLPYGFKVAEALKVANLLIDNYGFTPAGACGVSSNVFRECDYDGYNVTYDPSTGLNYYGACQWDEVERWPTISEWLYVNDYSYGSLTGQIMAIFDTKEAVIFACAIDDVKNSNDPQYAARRWAQGYEICASQYVEIRAESAVWVYYLWQLDKAGYDVYAL